MFIRATVPGHRDGFAPAYPHKAPGAHASVEPQDRKPEAVAALPRDDAPQGAWSHHQHQERGNLFKNKYLLAYYL